MDRVLRLLMILLLGFGLASASFCFTACKPMTPAVVQIVEKGGLDKTLVQWLGWKACSKQAASGKVV